MWFILMFFLAAVAVECFPEKYQTSVQGYVNGEEFENDPHVEIPEEGKYGRVYEARGKRTLTNSRYTHSDKYFDPYLSKEVRLEGGNSYEQDIDPYYSGEIPHHIPRPTHSGPPYIPFQPVSKDNYKPVPPHRQPITLVHNSANPKDILPIPTYIPSAPASSYRPVVKPVQSQPKYKPIPSASPKTHYRPPFNTPDHHRISAEPTPSKPQLRVRPLSSYPSLESVQDAISHVEPIKSESAAYPSEKQYDGHEHKGRVSFQIHGHKGPKSYRFGYDAGKGSNRQFRFEERDNDGFVRGRYGYYDREGKLFAINYSADPKGGFKVEPAHD